MARKDQQMLIEAYNKVFLKEGFVHKLTKPERRMITDSLTKHELDGDGRFGNASKGISALNKTLDQVGFDLDSQLIFEKYTKILEGPVSEIGTLGDWSEKSKNRYDLPSIKLLKNPDYVTKLKNQFAKDISIDFNLWFLKSKNASKYSEYGIIKPIELNSMIRDINLEKVIESSNPSNITVIFTNNIGIDKVSLTPWMIGHRIGHVLYQARRSNKIINTEWNLFENNIIKSFNNFFDFNFQSIRDFSLATGVTKKRLLNILNSLGKFRSARQKRISRPYEFIFECFAQYLTTGDLTFNELKNDLYAALEISTLFQSGIDYILNYSRGHILLI